MNIEEDDGPEDKWTRGLQNGWNDKLVLLFSLKIQSFVFVLLQAF